MTEREKAEFQLWKEWHSKVYLPCRDKRYSNPDGVTCERELKVMQENGCSMECCPKAQRGGK